MQQGEMQRLDIFQYVSGMLDGLRDLADKAEHPMLVYLIEMTRHECQDAILHERSYQQRMQKRIDKSSGRISP